MTERLHARVALQALLVASGLALSGCMSSPTYGTDKTSGEQLVGDLSGAFSLVPEKKAPIDYKPRPNLVKPAPGQKESLPVPQDDIVQTASNQWPESPEQRRARIRASATANQDNRFYESEVINDLPTQTSASANTFVSDKFDPRENARMAREQSPEVKKRLAQSKQGSPNTRRYLSEPPLDYRVASANAPQDELGEDEYVKERRLKRAASKKGGMFDWLPW